MALTIYIDDKPYDVAAHYRDKHKMELPPQPTMSGVEIIHAAGREIDSLTHRVFRWFVSKEKLYEEVHLPWSVPLRHDMKFYILPPARY